MKNALNISTKEDQSALGFENNSVELSDQFKTPIRAIFRENFWLIGGVCLFIVFGALLGNEDLHQEELGWYLNLNIVIFKNKLVLLVLTAILCCKLSYAFLYRQTFRYYLEGNRLKISRGILFREEASLPLIPLTEIYIKRNLLDTIFNLSNLYVALAAERVRGIAEIRGLDGDQAPHVRSAILQVIERQITVNQDR
jgi:membrane protein YdbS with pleckstrin-like domain